jgi:hypothetical protein
MRTRKSLVLELISNNKLEIKYVHTSKMVVDGLMKPYKGSIFDFFANYILG